MSHDVGSVCEVKISGVRIECEEVSAVLKAHPVVADALVTASWLRTKKRRPEDSGPICLCLEFRCLDYV